MVFFSFLNRSSEGTSIYSSADPQHIELEWRRKSLLSLGQNHLFIAPQSVQADGPPPLGPRLNLNAERFLSHLSNFRIGSTTDSRPPARG